MAHSIQIQIQSVPCMVYVFPALVTPYVKISAFLPSRKSCNWLLTVRSKSSDCVTSGLKIYKIIKSERAADVVENLAWNWGRRTVPFVSNCLQHLWEGEFVERHADALLAALHGGRALRCVERYRLAVFNHDTVLARTEESSVLKRSNQRPWLTS